MNMVGGSKFHCKFQYDSTAYAQQQCYFDSIGCDADPRQKVLDDLAECIRNWQNEGDEIVLMMDMNEDITNHEVQNWANNLGLVESILVKHQS